AVPPATPRAILTFRPRSGLLWLARALGIFPAFGIFGASTLRGGLEIWRGDLFGRVTTRAEADSNIYASSLGTGDFILTSIPEVGFKRAAGLVILDTLAGLEMKRFAANPIHDAVNPFATASVEWAPTDGKTSGQFQASARRVTLGNPDVNERTTSDQY